MKRDVMLPKFNLPGQTSWLMKGLWIAGGVVLLQVGVVTTILLLRHRDGVESTAVAMPVAEASPAPAPRAPAAEPPAPAAAPEPAAAPAARTAPPPSDPPRLNRPGRLAKAGAGRFDRRGKLRGNGGRLFTRNAMGPRKIGGPARGMGGAAKGGRRPGMRNAAANTRKPDDIDRLLRNFK
jgi:hypothetical protein